MEGWSYEGECGIRVSRHLKEVLIWAVQKYFWFNYYVMCNCGIQLFSTALIIMVPWDITVGIPVKLK